MHVVEREQELTVNDDGISVAGFCPGEEGEVAASVRHDDAQARSSVRCCRRRSSSRKVRTSHHVRAEQKAPASVSTARASSVRDDLPLRVVRGGSTIPSTGRRDRRDRRGPDLDDVLAGGGVPRQADLALVPSPILRPAMSCFADEGDARWRAVSAAWIAARAVAPGAVASCCSNRP